MGIQSIPPVKTLEPDSNFSKIIEAFQETGKQYRITIDTEAGMFDNNKKPMTADEIKAPYVTPTQYLSKQFHEFFDLHNGNTKITFEQTKPVEVVYDTMDDKDNVKIAERYPTFGYGSLLDEVLEDFGGVQEIVRCSWDENINEGEVVCLMKDWRVFRYVLKQNDFAALKHEDRITKINRECLVCEDMDDWGHWEELGGTREEQEKKALQQKITDEKMSEYTEKYSDALTDFFNGGIESLQKMMAKNTNV